MCSHNDRARSRILFGSVIYSAVKPDADVTSFLGRPAVDLIRKSRDTSRSIARDISGPARALEAAVKARSVLSLSLLMQP